MVALVFTKPIFVLVNCAGKRGAFSTGNGQLVQKNAHFLGCNKCSSTANVFVVISIMAKSSSVLLLPSSVAKEANFPNASTFKWNIQFYIGHIVILGVCLCVCV